MISPESMAATRLDGGILDAAGVISIPACFFQQKR
jgi:hypothetical protein